MVCKAKSEAERNMLDTRRNDDQNLSLMVTHTINEAGYITVARKVDLKAMRESSALVTTQASVPIEVSSPETVSRTHACMTAKSTMHVHPGHPCSITIASFSKVDVHLAEHQ